MLCMKWLWVLLVLLPSVLGATIHGNVYDFGLNKLSNAVVDIDTSPRQQMVAAGGNYSFIVPAGNYLLKAKYKDSDVMENISVRAEGDYIIDLILLPSVEAISTDVPDIPYVEDVIQDRPASHWFLWLIAFALLGWLTYRVSRGPSVKKEVIKEIKEVAVGEELNKIVEFIEKEGGQATQKDIRRNFPYSEAKISLMIDDLESKGLVKRIKKGRGNVIVKA